MIRPRVFLGTALALAAIFGSLGYAQSGDEEKKKRDSRKAPEEMRAVASPTPKETPEPKAKPKPAPPEIEEEKETNFESQTN